MGLISDIPSGAIIPITVLATDNNKQDLFNTVDAAIKIVVLDDFDRIAFEFNSNVGCVIANDMLFAE